MYSRFLNNSSGKSIQELISLGLKHHRSKQGLTQEALANAISVSRTSYTRIENGHTCPNMITMCSLLNLFDVSLEDFLETSLEEKVN